VQGTSPPALASGAFRGASLTAPARARARSLVYPTRNQRPSPGFPGLAPSPGPRAGARHSGRLSRHQRRWDPRRGTESRSCRLSKHCRRKSPHSPCCRLSCPKHGPQHGANSAWKRRRRHSRLSLAHLTPQPHPTRPAVLSFRPPSETPLAWHAQTVAHACQREAPRAETRDALTLQWPVA